MADAISAKTAWALAKAIKGGSKRKGPTNGTATVVRVDQDGTHWVRISGSDVETPVNGAITVDAKAGDTVEWSIHDGRLSITGNESQPSVGMREVFQTASEIVQPVVARITKVSELAALSKNVADAAQRVADAVNQHFFADDGGIHVTEATQEEWETSHSGANVLINSVGQLFRDGLNNLLTLTTENGARALTIWDGLGNAAANVRAVFGEVIMLGNASDGSVVTIDSDSMDMVHGTTEMLHLGYGEGASMSGTAVAPYYTIGARRSTSTVGNYSVAEGYATTASGYTSHAEGSGATASGSVSHAEGDGTASGNYSHAEGFFTVASGDGAHAEGQNTTASGNPSHAEGTNTTASGGSAHAEGSGTTASGLRSHAQNRGTIAAAENQTALGRFNTEDANGVYAVIVGNGTSDSNRSNALTVDWDGNVTHGVDVPWTNLQLASSVEPYSDGQTPRYRKWGPVVQVLGAVKLKSNQSAGFNVNIGTLPSGCRPLTQVATVCQGSGNDTWLCNVSAGGVMNIERYRNGGTSAAATTSTWLPFSITFLTA